MGAAGAAARARAEHPAADAAARRNGVGYTNYPDNVVQFFVQQAAKGGIDLFRVFDCLNWVENMRVSIDAVREAGKLCEGGDLLHRRSARPGAGEVRPQVLRRLAQGAGRRPARTSSASRTWRGCAAARGARAGQGAEGGDRPADPFPHARHLRHRRGDRAGGGRRRRRCGRCGDGCDVRPHLAADLGSIVEALRHGAARSGPRSAKHPQDLVLLGAGAHAVPRLRERPPLRRVGGLPARDAGRPVHQPKEQARSLGLESALARGRADLCRRQPDVRRHRQGDAVLQGGRRHGADDGDERPDRRRCRSAHATSPSRTRWCSCFAAISASRRAASRRRCRRRC